MLEQDWNMMSQLPSIKRAWQYLPRIGRNDFPKKSDSEFPTLHHLPFQMRHLNDRDSKLNEVRAYVNKTSIPFLGHQIWRNQSSTIISALTKHVTFLVTSRVQFFNPLLFIYLESALFNLKRNRTRLIGLIRNIIFLMKFVA